MPLVVLTGVNGFIGTNVCEKILSSTSDALGFEKKQILRFSNFDMNKKNIHELGHTSQNSSDHIHVLGSDIPLSLNRDIAKRFLGSSRYTYCDFESLFETLENLPTPPDIIVHNGACSSTTETNAEIFEKLNFEYSQKIWNYCTQKNIPLIYASSAAIYGSGEYGFSDKKEDCHKYKALNLYGESKLNFDLWVMKQKRTPPTWFGLRYFNVFGPHEEHKKSQASMCYHGYNQVISTKTIKLFKSNSEDYQDGEQERDFVSIDDVVNITKLLIKKSILRKRCFSDILLPENGLFLNVGSGIPHTWNTLAARVFETIGLPINIEYIPIPENIINQYQNYTCANLSLFTAINPEYNFSMFDEAVKKYIQSYLLRGGVSQ